MSMYALIYSEGRKEKQHGRVDSSGHSLPAGQAGGRNRDEFNDAIKRSGVDGLIKMLVDKNKGPTPK